MITSYNDRNVADYKALFNEAADILSGYRRVRTFEKKKDGNLYKYYYKSSLPTYTPTGKDGELTMADILKGIYLEVTPAINSLESFAEALNKHDVLYVTRVEYDDIPSYEVPATFDPRAGITTLEEYYSWIADLGKINRKYTVLPLDKEHFVINANTRAILIPGEYKKNGIAVQGDDLAEVVYFKIDRFFDYMDLNTTDIFIQWETPKGPDGKSVKSVSEAYIRDIESEPGKLIFGWAISDALTGVAGNIKFSVRFFKWVNKDTPSGANGKRELAYSFSTLTTSVAVQPSIGLNIEEIDEYRIDSCGERLIARLENSTVAGGYIAALPKFDENLEARPYEYDLDADGNYTLKVMATAADTGVVTYAWKRTYLKQDNTPDDGSRDLTAYSQYSFEKLAPTYEELMAIQTAPKYMVYRKALDNEYIPYTEEFPINPDFAKTHEGAEGFMLYKKYSTLTINKDVANADGSDDTSGLYYAIAKNRITNSLNDNQSNAAFFPRPEDVEFSAGGHPQPSVWLTDADGNTTGIIKAVVKERKNAAGNNVETYEYKWYKYIGENDLPIPDAQNPDKNTLSKLNIPEADMKFMDMTTTGEYQVNPSDTGYYYVKVIATRNGATKSKISDIWTRVTPFAHVPTKFTKVQGEASQFPWSDFSDDLTKRTCPIFKIVTEDVPEVDAYHVQWCKVLDTNLEENDDGVFEAQIVGYEAVTGWLPVELNTDGEYVVALTKNIVNEYGKDPSKNIYGPYFPIIKATLNNSEKTSIIPTVITDDSLVYTITAS